jgi:uncharacterized protein with HEPN domain
LPFEYPERLNFTAYQHNEKTKAAVERKMQILTEGVIRFEGKGAETYPDIDWKGYRGLGNFLRHSYHRVSDEIVWNTVNDDLPELKRIVERALPPSTSPTES